jgi:predicted nucleic acid-binding protein
VTELADTSAWTNRQKNPETLAAFNELLGARQIATCGMVKLELLWASRDHGDFRSMREELDALDDLPIRSSVWNRAIDVLERLAARGPLHQRHMELPDLIIAGCAEAAGIPVCHYDRDFELIAEVTGQPVRAIAPLGSL